MKRTIYITAILLLLSAGGASAQHYIGVRGGWGGGSARFLPKREMGYEWGLFSGGISYKFYTKERYVGAIQADLQFIERGFAYDESHESDESYHRTVQSIELPFMLQPHFYLFARSMRVYINLGVYFNYNIRSEYRIESKINGVLEQGDYPFRTTRDNRWGYGLCGGFGIGVLFGRCELNIEGRYYLGYSDILRNHTKYKGNPMQSPMDNVNISMGFYYRLGKEGIRSAPSKAVAAKLQEKEAKRILRLREKGKLPADERIDIEIVPEGESLQERSAGEPERSGEVFENAEVDTQSGAVSPEPADLRENMDK